MKKIWGIYFILNKKTGQLYIGQSNHIYRRFNQHCQPSSNKLYIDKDIKKYGKENFLFDIIEILPHNNNLLDSREEYWIAYYNTFKDPFHYNEKPGGKAARGKNHPMYNKHHSEDTRKKISKKLKNRNLSYKTRKKIGRSLKKVKKGIKLSEKHCESISNVTTSTGIYNVSKQNNKKYKQGFIWRYTYTDKNGKRNTITSINLIDLEKKVISQGLKWKRINKKLATKSYKENERNMKKYPKRNSYSIWDIYCCHFNKQSFLRNGNEGQNPCKCFRLKYNGKAVPIGLFYEFISPQKINKLIIEFSEE